MAKLSDAAQLDVANKLALGIASTNTDKNYFEEEFPWAPTVLASEIWADDVPFAATPMEADAIAAGLTTDSPTNPVVEKLTLAVMDEIPLSNGQGWTLYDVPGVPDPETRIVDWLNPQSFGAGYFFQLFENDNTPIALTDGRYQVDSKNGIVRFDEGFTPADLGLLTPLKITVYRYDGRKGVFVGDIPSGGGGGDCGVPHQEIVSFIDVTPMDGDTIVGSTTFGVANVEAFKLYLNKLFLVQGQDYDLVGPFKNQILWLIDTHGVSLTNGEDQLVACYSEACESFPLIPRQQELVPEDVGVTDGDTTLTSTLDTPVFNPESVRLYHNKLIQVQGPGRDYSLTGPGYTNVIWQVDTGTAQPLESTDELVAHFLQDADSIVGPTGPTGPTGTLIGPLDSLADVEVAGTFSPIDGDLLGFVGTATDGFWTAVAPPMTQDLQSVLAVGNTTGANDIVFGVGRNLLWSTDGNGNIGALGANRPDTIYAATSVVIGDTVTIGTNAISASLGLDIDAGSGGELRLGHNIFGVIRIGAQGPSNIFLGGGSGSQTVTIQGGSGGVLINGTGIGGATTIGSLGNPGSLTMRANPSSTISFQSQGAGSATTMHSSSDVAGLVLSGFTATSLIGALNELRSASTQITNGTAVTSNDTADIGERVVYDPSGGTFTINAPASPSIGDRWAVKNRTSSLTAVTIDGNGNNIENPTSSFALVANFSLSGDGISAEWEYDGTQWVAI